MKPGDLLRGHAPSNNHRGFVNGCPDCQRVALEDAEWITPSTPLPPYCIWCTMDGHTFKDCPARKAGEPY